MPRGGGLGYLAVLFAALAIFFASVVKHAYYTPDGVVYARYAARDAGMSERDATLAARAFYEHTALINVPRYRALVEIDPSVAFERSRIFANRPLYPRLVSVLLPRIGFRALFVVSGIAYVAFGLALYWLLSVLGSRLVAFGLTALALAAPVTRIAGSADLTDMLALFLWTAWLAALMQYLRARNKTLPAVLAAAGSLLVLTRPAIYLPAVPGIVALIVSGTVMEAASLGVIAVVFAVLMLTSRAFGAGEQLRWIYQNAPGAKALPYDQWYRTALAQTVSSAIAGAVRVVAPAVAVACAAYAFVGGYRREVYVLFAAFVACLLAIPLNPIPDQLGRIVGLPLLPVLCGMIQLGAARYSDERAAAHVAGTRAA